MTKPFSREQVDIDVTAQATILIDSLDRDYTNPDGTWTDRDAAIRFVAEAMTANFAVDARRSANQTAEVKEMMRLAKFLATEVYGYGMQNIDDTLDLATAEFNEVWRAARRLLTAIKELTV